MTWALFKEINALMAPSSLMPMLVDESYKRHDEICGPLRDASLVSTAATARTPILEMPEEDSMRTLPLALTLAKDLRQF